VNETDNGAQELGIIVVKGANDFADGVAVYQ